jgi:hypothetical protein
VSFRSAAMAFADAVLAFIHGLRLRIAAEGWNLCPKSASWAFVDDT